MTDEQIAVLFNNNGMTTSKGTAGEKGTGFGMPIVASFLERMGGRNEVTSKVATPSDDESGTTFNIYLKDWLDS